LTTAHRPDINEHLKLLPSNRKAVHKLCQVVMQAITDFVEDVRGGSFPKDEHCYNMVKGEEERFKLNLA
jgi:ketopantoate hydroxymethyltransferase